MKKFFSCLLLIIVFMSCTASAFAQPAALTLPTIDLEYTTLPQAPSISSKKAVIIDNVTGTILYNKGNLTDKLYPASITKILTAIVVLDNVDSPDDAIVTVSRRATNLSEGSSIMGLKYNDKISVTDLLYGLMLRSGNDAAIALAEFVGESVNGFAQMMNDKADELGALNSNFKNPHGLHNAEHYTCLHDIALFAHTLTKYPLLEKIVKSGTYTAHATRNNRNTTLELVNTNHFVIPGDKYYNKYYTGLKTGTTNAAGYCLSTRYQKNSKDIIVLTFNGDQEKYYSEMADLVTYAERNFTTISLRDIFSTRDFTVRIENATVADLNNGMLDLRIDSIPDTQYVTTTAMAQILRNTTDPVSVELPQNLTAPIYVGDDVGKITIYLGDKILLEGNLIATRTILDHLEVPNDLLALHIDINKPQSAWHIILIILCIIIAMVAIFAVFFLIKLYLYNRKKKKYRHSNIYVRRNRSQYKY